MDREITFTKIRTRFHTGTFHRPSKDLKETCTTNFIYHPASGSFYYGPDPRIESTHLEDWLDNSPNIDEDNVDVHNSIRGSISDGEIRVHFSTRYWKEENIKRMFDELRPYLKKEFGTDKVLYSSGDYGSNKKKRHGFYDSSSRHFNVDAALEKFKKKMGVAHLPDADGRDDW